MVPSWYSIPAVTALLSGGCIFAFCPGTHRFHSFMGFTLVFDGLFMMLGGIIGSDIGQFYGPIYILYVAMMLLSPFFYYFAMRSLLRENGIGRKDLWMLEVVAVFTVILASLLPGIPAADKYVFLQILQGSAAVAASEPTGTAVLLALDDTAYLLFLAEMLFVQIFCLLNLRRYGQLLQAFYSNLRGKALPLIKVIFVLVGLRFMLYVAFSLSPELCSQGWFHTGSTVACSLFYLPVALFACKIGYTAEELGKMTVARDTKAQAPSGSELISSRLEGLLGERFYLDPDTDLMGLADKIGVNYKYVADYLKFKYGETFMNFVNRLRIEYSETLLRDTGLQMIDVAEQSGFISESTFYRNFVKIKGMTPSQFRKTQ